MEKAEEELIDFESLVSDTTTPRWPGDARF